MFGKYYKKKISLVVFLVFFLSVAFMVAPLEGNIIVTAGNGQTAAVGTAVATRQAPR